ncbi:DUF3306 domain-containing protein [Roseobacter sp. YSTF-M11]|uniref:DUF3306 domain-containing protein n=1 Tax=Roseobacter insulae TaxID=2859783 RepID=A0A9X1FZ58_9RHOB|nr:DUF3306 domain-containing protein [Roseobacter insulae]MBW4710057.1 DUF3306 domain-containing protein [Roseobacter insulae]
MTAQASFWARRRAGAKAEAEAEARAESAATEAAQAAELAGKDDADVLTELGLPDPATLQAGDDFAAFMARDVPRHLQNKALRTLWRSNPVLACVDGLNEYDDDYRAAMLAGGPIKTAYQVGKGMLSHLEETARQEEAARVAAEMDDAEEVVPEPEDGVIAQPAAEPAGAPQAALSYSAEEETPAEQAPRRMRFRFEEASV